MLAARGLARRRVLGARSVQSVLDCGARIGRDEDHQADQRHDGLAAQTTPGARRAKSTLTKLAPGLAASAVVMQGGFMGAEYLGQGLLALQGISGASPISGIPVAILLGMGIKNTVGVPSQLEEGIKFATKPVLQAGIVCVGAKLSAVDLVTTGLVGLPAVMASIGVGLTFIPWLGNKMGLPAKMSSLIAAGTSICGVTAITALAPAIKATQQDTSFAVANVVAFGTMGMLVYPYVAHAIIPSSHAIGIALGLSVHDTSQVIGCALSYSTVFGDEEVLKVATVTKLTRNLFLAGVIPGLTYMTARREGELAAVTAAAGTAGSPVTSTKAEASLIPSFADVKKYFPGFVAGFVGMSALRTVGDMTLAGDMGAAFGVFDADTWKSLTKFVGNELGSHYLLGTAMAAVGLSTSASALRGVGVKPFIVGLAGAGAVGATGFSTALILHHVFHVA